MRTTPAILFGTMLLWALPVAAQEAKPAPQKETAKPALTAEQILDKAVEATGGKAAHAKLNSRYAKGTLELDAGGNEMKGTLEMWAKAPNKQFILTHMDAVGDITNGCDGEHAWSDNPQGSFDMTGTQLENAKRQAVFHQEDWRQLYPKTEVTGKEKVGQREAWVVKLSPTTGNPMTQYFDAETFLLLRQNMTADTPQGSMDITSDFSDYRDVDGIKMPFQIKQAMPFGDMVIKLEELKHNVPIEDAKFAKPAAK